MSGTTIVKTYLVVRFDLDEYGSGLNAKINQQVQNVRSWAGHLGEVRVVSFFIQQGMRKQTGVLTIEHFGYVSKQT